LDPSNVSRKISKGIIPKSCIVHEPGETYPKLDAAKVDRALRARTDFSQPRAKPIKAPPPEVSDDDPDGLGVAIAAGGGEKSPLKKKVRPVAKSTYTKETIEGQEVTVQNVPDTGNDPFERFRSAKTDTETMRARKLELEVAEMEGRLLDAEDVRKRVVKLVGETRDAFGNLAGKLAPTLVGITDPIEMETTIMKAINEALESLSRFES
jgi:hypothetical protein